MTVLLHDPVIWPSFPRLFSGIKMTHGNAVYRKCSSPFLARYIFNSLHNTASLQAGQILLFLP